MTTIEMAKEVVRALDKKKATNIKLLDISGLTTLGDYFVIASGGSNTQVRSLADEVQDTLTKKGVEPHKVEGHQSAMWILLDYLDVMVHLFCEETRNFYALERLWQDAKEVDITDILTED